MKKSIALVKYMLPIALCALILLSASAFPPPAKHMPVQPVRAEKSFMPPKPDVYPEFYDTSLSSGARLSSAATMPKLSESVSPGGGPYNSGEAVKVLVIPVQFTDEKLDSGINYRDLFFGPVNSLKTYYEANSYYEPGVRGVTIAGEVAPVVTSIRTMAYYGQDSATEYDAYNCNVNELAREAVQLLRSTGFSFSGYDVERDEYGETDGTIDHLIIIHAGMGQEETRTSNDIWSHHWAISGGEKAGSLYAYNYSMVPENSLLGQMAHEFGHDLGLPDLYDADGSDSGGKSSGAGVWDVMASGSWLGDGNCPAGLSAWSKAFLGWVQPQSITADGSYTLHSAASYPDVLRLTNEESTRSGVHYLVEYRELELHDAFLPGSGLLVWKIADGMVTQAHTDENDVNNNPSCLGVELVQADGDNDLRHNYNRGDDGDPFPGATGSPGFISVPYGHNYSSPGIFSYIEVSDIAISDGLATAYISVEKAPVSAAPYSLSAQTMVPEYVLTPSLSWSHTSKAEYYKLQVSEDSSFNTRLYDTEVYDLGFVPSAPLEYGKKYYWWVAGLNSMNDEASSIWSDAAVYYTGSVLQGDCNADSRVDLTDLVIISLAYGSRTGDERWDIRGDMNRDGSVDIADFDILKQNF
jgi:M6 family metalloprotease-like protein